VLTLDLVNTVAFSGLVLFLAYGIRRQVPVLARYNLPAPVIGGLLIATVITVARARGMTLVAFDTTLQAPLMIAFFTSVGFGASLGLLQRGGPAVLLFFVASTVIAVVQNVIGGALAAALGQHPLMGVLAGSVTLTGGPATGLAFAPMFEQAGVTGAATLAVAAAMVGIVGGGIIGGPVATWLISRLPASGARPSPHRDPPVAENLVEDRMPEPVATAPSGEDVEAYRLLKHLVIMLVAMWIGAWVTRAFAMINFTLPAYIGAMLVAAAIRNFDDRTGLVGVSQRTIDDLGGVALSLFLVMALMTLRLWELIGLAVPLTIILTVQVIAIAAIAIGPVFRLMGRDYEAAVIAGGFCGFMLGTTANAMANMEALVERYGPAPKAFLVVPMVGAFFVDFTNALIITTILNFWR
jgi:ESS family glutamate:Na+ symporter